MHIHTKDYIYHTIQVETEQEIMKYLYDNLYEEILSINENGSIEYHTHSGVIYAVSNLFSGFSIVKLDEQAPVSDWTERCVWECENKERIDVDFYNECSKYKPDFGLRRGRGGWFHNSRSRSLYNPNSPKNCNVIKPKNVQEKIPYETFLKLIVFLQNWCGEYGDNILTIKQLDDNKWSLYCRIE